MGSSFGCVISSYLRGILYLLFADFGVLELGVAVVKGLNL